ncbi:hypothetical protein niasHT_006761 [Heterodera trifolii]|uniref:Uncharacterized protein n=1 Tax=Heterodera trifolii TaxID=157864 RepID=A0ABD2LWP3_9BILA
MEERRRRQNALLSKFRKRTKTGLSSSPTSSSMTTNDGVLAERNVTKTDDGCGGSDEDIQIVDTDEQRKNHDELRQKAAEALIREAKRSAQRAQLYGPQGWIKPRVLNTNKAFLARTLKSVEIQRRDQQTEKEAKRARKVREQTEE